MHRFYLWRFLLLDFFKCKLCPIQETKKHKRQSWMKLWQFCLRLSNVITEKNVTREDKNRLFYTEINGCNHSCFSNFAFVHLTNNHILWDINVKFPLTQSQIWFRCRVTYNKTQLKSIYSSEKINTISPNTL